MKEEFRDRLNFLAAHSNKIEGRLKSVENIRQEVVIASINELRYAGRRFVDAWAICSKSEMTEQDEAALEEHFIIAKQYLINADHDLTDAVCIYVHGQIAKMQEKYGVDEILKVDPNFVEFAERMQSANDIVTGSRETRADRDNAYKDLEDNYIKDLLGKHNRLKFAEGLVLTRQKRRSFKTAAMNYIGFIGCIIGLPGAIIGIIGWDGVVKLPIVNRLLPVSGAPEGGTDSNKLPVFTMPLFNPPPAP